MRVIVSSRVWAFRCVSQYFSQIEAVSATQQRREGWGSAEATEMVINNLLYITAKVSHCPDR